MKELDDLIDEYNEIDIDGAITLSEDLNYLTSYLNIYTNLVEYDTITKDNVKKIMADTGLKTFITERPLKKEISDVIIKNGGKIIFIKTGAFPEEDENNDELMQKFGLINILKENLNELKK